MMFNRRVFSLGAAALLMTLPVLMEAKSAAETRMRANLTGARIGTLTPSGKADYRARQGSSRLNVEVEDVNVAPGTVLDVYLDGAQIGTITVAPVIQGGELELNSNDGAMVPSVKSGALVVVKNGASAVVAGVF
jgi:hypothetical protein